MKRRIACLLLVVIAFSITSGAAHCATGAAGYTDQNIIINADAAVMLSDLGIIGGYPDGSFMPKNTITRAEACKMVRYMAAGQQPECALPVDEAESQGAVFEDTQDHWAYADILWCYEAGIISGYGGASSDSDSDSDSDSGSAVGSAAGSAAGTFRPDNEVTASELAKMLLVAAGCPTERYLGDSWQESVDADARMLGIYRGYVDSTSAKLNRDNAALLMYNTLQCPIVELWDGEDPEFYLDELMNPMTMLEYVWGLKKYTEVVLANEYADLDRTGGRLEAGFTRIRRHRDFYVSTELGYIGRRVDIYMDSNNRVYGKPIPVIEELYYVVSGDQLDAFIRINDLTLDSKTEYYLNYDFMPSGQDISLSAEVTVIDWERDGMVDMVLVTEYSYCTVTVVDAGGYHLADGPVEYVPLTEIVSQTGGIKAGTNVRLVQIGGQYYISVNN